MSKYILYIAGPILWALLYSASAFAQSGPGKFNVSGGLFHANGTAITNANVNFKVEVYDTAASCLLYSEEHLAQDLSVTKGGFSLEIGLGTSQSNPLEGTTAFSSKIFHNPGVVGAFSGCASGVTLASGSDRLIRVSYDLGSGFVAMTPDVPITSAPYAMVAESLQGKSATDFILTNVNTQLSQNSMEYLFTNTNYANLKALVDGTSTQYMVSNPASDVSFNSRKLVNVADPTSAQDAATKNYSDTFMGGQPVDMTGIAPGVGGNSVLAWDQVQNKWVARTFGSVSSITAGTGLNGGTIVSAGTLSVDVGTTANKILQLNGSAQIPAVNGSLLTNVNAVQLWSRDVSSVAPTAGQVLTWNVSGSMWEASTPSGGTITALVGDVTASGSGAVTATIANNAINSAKINSTGISKNLLLITDSTTGAGVGYMSCSLGQILQWDANGWGCVDMSAAMGPSGVAAGTYGSDTMVPRVTVDAQGRVTALSNVNIAFPVTSVAGRTGAVTLIASDIGGLGTAALVNVGTSSSNVPQLDAFGRMPAVDGSQLTNLTAGSVSGVATGTGLVGGTITTYGTLSVDVGTTANKIMQLTAGAQIPAVDGNLVTNVNAVKIQARNVSATAPNPGQVLGWNGSSSQWEPASVTSGTVTQVTSGTGLLGGPISSTGTLSVDVGTGANQIVQLDSSAKLPGVDGSALSNLNATRIGTRTVATNAPGIGQILSWNNSTSQWEPMAPATSGTVTNVATGNGLLGGPITNNGTLSVDTGTTGNKILQLTAGAQIPAVDGNLVTNVNAVKLQARDVASTAPTSGQVLAWNNLSSVWEPRSVTSGTVTNVATGTGLLGGPISSNGTLSVDVGTGANQIVQLDGTSKLPAVDGSQLTNLNATRIGTRTIATTAPSTGQYIGWNNSTSQWEPMAPATSGTVTNVATGNGLLGGPITNNGTLSVDTGVTGNKILQLTAGAQIPAVDGNLVTNVNAVKLQARDVSANAPGGGQVLGWNALNSVWEPTFVTNGTVIQISSGTGLLGGPISSTGTLSVDVGTGPNQIVQLDGTSKLPAVDGSQLTNLNATRIGTRTVATTAPGAGQVLSWNNLNSQWEPMAPATSGTVTNVATGNGLLGGPITNNGTLSVDTGVTGNKILQLTAGAQIPAVDGNLVTNVNAVKLQARDVAATAPVSGQVLGWNGLSGVWEPMSTAVGSVTNVAAGTGLLGGPISSSGTLSVDVGTGANQIVQLDSSAKLPALDGSALSNLNATRIGTRTIATTAPSIGQYIGWNNSTSQWEPMAPATSGTVTNVATGTGLLGGPISNSGTLSVDVGTTSNKILQLTATAQIPAVDGNLVTNVNAVKLQTRNVAATAPVTGQVLGWNGSSGMWEPMSTAVGSVTNITSGTGLLGGPISSSGTLSVDVGTGANQIVQLDSSAKLPAVDGSSLSNLNATRIGTRSIATTAPSIGQYIGWNNSTTQWEPMAPATSGTVTNVATGTGLVGGPISNTGTISVDVGTTSNKILQLTASAQIPAVDGNLVTNVNAVKIQARDIAATAPTPGQVLAWNALSSVWEPTSATAGSVTHVQTGTGLIGGPISSTGTISVDVGTTSNKILQLNASGQIPAVDGSLLTNINAWKIGGNTTLSNANIGTIDNYALNVLTNNTSRIYVGNDGKVGIGTSMPQAILDVASTASGDSAIIVPRDTTARRPASAANGMIRYNTSTSKFEAFENNAWVNMTPNGVGLAASGNSGALQYSNGAGTFLANNNIVVDGTNGRIGIGTASPSDILHIYQNANAAVRVFVNNPSTGTGAFSEFKGTTNAGDMKIGLGSSSNIATLGNAGKSYWIGPSDFQLAPGGTEKVRITASGNVGIGTSMPQALLDLSTTTSGQSAIIVPRDNQANRPSTGVNGMIRYNTSTSTLESFANGSWQSLAGAGTGSYLPLIGGTLTGPILQANGTAAAPSYSFSASTGTGVYSPTAGNLSLATNGVQRLNIDSSGNVGIGTSSPASKLDVLSYNINVGADWSTGTARTDATGKGGYVTFPHYTNSQPPIAMIGSLNSSSGNTVSFGGGTTNYNAATNLVFYTAANSTTVAGTERMRIDSNGNVGIGTNTPNAAFHVNIAQNSSTSARVENSDPGTSALASMNIVSEAAGIQIASYSTTVSSAFGGQPVADSVVIRTFNSPAPSRMMIGTQTAIPMYLVTGNTTRMAFDSSGNVGIGTSMPQALLDLATTTSGQSALIVPRDTTANRPSSGVNGMVRYNTDTAAFEGFANGSWGSLAGSGVGQWNTGAANSINYTAGNVGIGTTSPGISNVAGRTYLTVKGSTDAGVVELASGATDADGADVGNISFMDVGNSRRVAMVHSSLSGATASNRGGELKFYTKVDGASSIPERMRITSSGNVGIGTSSPTAKLEVAGSVSTSDWGTAGIGFKIPTATYQNTTSSGTINSSVHVIASPTLSATNPTTVNVSTLAISAPTMSTNVTGGSVSALSLVGNLVQSVGSASFSAGTTPSFAGLVNLNGNRSASSWNTNGAMLAVHANTLTNSSGSGTLATQVSNSFGAPTMASTNALTVTNAANVYIAGAPVAGTNTTITNAQALHVASGTSYFGGNVGVGTTTPQAVLDVATTTSGQSAIIVPRDTTANRPATGVNGMLRYNTNTAAFEGFANGSWGSLAGSGAGQWNTGAANSINYTAGNVGIGTTSPDSKFQVYNSSTSYLSYSTNLLTLKHDNLASPPQIRLDNGAGNGTGYIDFFTYTVAGQTTPTVRWAAVDRNGFTGQHVFYAAQWGSPNLSPYEVMTVGNNGTDGGGDHFGVGILTTYPKSSLDVNGNVSIGSYAGTNAAPTGGMIVSGRVGIGTPTPQALLDLSTTTSGLSAIIVPRDTTANRPATGVNGMIRYNTDTNVLESYVNGGWASLAGAGASYLPLSGGSMTGPILQADGSSSAPSYSFSASTGTGVYSSATDNLSLATSGAQRVNIDQLGNVAIGTSSALYVSANGRIGIGTDSPSRLLDVSSSSTATSIGIVNSSVGGKTFTLGSTGAGNALGAGNFYLYDADNSAFRMVVSPTGNVGIGTLTPSAKLDVKEGAISVRSSSTNAGLYLYNSNVGDDATLRGYKSGGSSVDSPSAVPINTRLLRIQGIGHDGTSYSGNGNAEIRFQAAEAFTPTAKGTYLTFLTTPLGSTTAAERLRITSSGAIGIGTNNPQALLDLDTTTSGQSAIIVPRDTTAKRPSPGVNGMLRYNTSTSSFEGFANGTWGSLGGGGGGSGDFMKDGSVAMTGNINVGSFSLTNVNSIRGISAFDLFVKPADYVSSSQSGKNLILEGGNNSDTNDTTGGSVNIKSGTGAGSSPTSGNINLLTPNAGGGTGSIAIGTGSSGYTSGTISLITGTAITTPGVVTLGVAGAEKMRVHTNGYIGIGTASPTTILTMKTSTNSYGWRHTDGNIILSSYVGGNNGWFGTDSSHNLAFYTNGSAERMLIDTTGKVGIGTTTPIASLEVAGNIVTSANTRTTAAVSKTSNTTLISLSQLTANLEAGKTYAFEIRLYVTANISGGIKITLDGGTATATNIIGNSQTTSSAGTDRITALSTQMTPQVSTDLVEIKGTITVGSTGTFIPRFAQQSSNATPTTVEAGSTMFIQQIK